MLHKKLHSEINKYFEEHQFDNPIFVQKPAVSSFKSGADTLVESPEGSGKTTALASVLIHQLGAALNDVPRALILTYNKEQADKLKDLLDEIGRFTNLRNFVVYPGPNLQKLKDSIYFGSDIVIGTPKRLNELYSNNGLNFNDLKYFIIDDANETIRPETLSLIDRLAGIKTESQKMLMCHTLNDNILRFADMHMPLLKLIQYTDESSND
ncbi:MAG: DEAD/DEAH box helicase [Bacteroidales bacterium]|nr:DEAD/DEAH box helicase [Bacteroidales bacterium]